METARTTDSEPETIARGFYSFEDMAKLFGATAADTLAAYRASGAEGRMSYGTRVWTRDEAETIRKFLRTRAAVTFTHIGGRARIGYQQCGKLWNHYEPKAGRTHALNKSGYRCYAAVCGVGVPVDSSDQFDQGGGNPIEPAVGSSRKVTCKACLRRNPVAIERPKRVRFAVMFRVGDQTDTYCHQDTRGQAETVAANVLRNGLTFGTRVDATWVEQVETYAS